jgi:hypothetical protein
MKPPAAGTALSADRLIPAVSRPVDALGGGAPVSFLDSALSTGHVDTLLLLREWLTAVSVDAIGDRRQPVKAESVGKPGPPPPSTVRPAS